MTQHESNTFTITVSDNREHKFNVKLRALTRKAKRLGLPAPEVINRRSFQRWFKDAAYLGGGYYANLVEITLNASRLAIDGDWEVCGSIEPSPVPNKNFVNLAPNVKGIRGNDYVNHDMHCDHCNTLRRRNKCVIIRNTKSNEVKVVGSTCLLSYTGIDPQAALFCWDVEECYGEPNWTEGASVSLSTLTVLEYTLAAIRVDKGYVKKSYGYDDYEGRSEVPTASVICSMLWGTDRYAKELRATYHPSDDDKAKAKAILEDWKNIDEATANDFTMKLHICALAEGVANKMLPVIAGGCSGWLKRQSNADKWAAQNAEKAKLPSPSFIGSIGEKVEVEVEVDVVRECDGYYGTSVMISGHVVGTRNKFTWFCSGGNYQGLASNYLEPVAGIHKIRMTVKKHQDHPKYGKATMVVRVKAL